MDKARKHIQVADHLIYMTYPVVREPRLLLSALEHIFLGMAAAQNMLLERAVTYKRLLGMPHGFQAKLRSLRTLYPGLEESCSLLQELETVVRARKESAVEFRRQNRLVICSDDYDLTIISVERLKGMVAKAKLFIERADGLLRENGRVSL